PAAATYGRKALAARKRVAVPAPSFSTAAASAPNAGTPKLPAALSVVSTKVREASDASDQSIDSASSSSDVSSPESDGEAGDRQWVRRTAHLAISRLDSLYEDTKSGLLFHGMAGAASGTGDGSSTAAPSSSRDLLKSTKDEWDLDGVPNDLLSSVGMSGAERAARDKLESPAKQPSKRAVGEGSKAIKKAKSSQPTANRGPSTATSKRMQMRAHAHNVIYTYGRPRDEDDGSEISPTLGLQSVFETTGRPTLDPAQNNSTKRAPGCLLDAVNPADSIDSSNNSSRTEDDLTMLSGMFKQHVGAIIRGLSASGRTEDSTTAACETLLCRLEDQGFCEDLLSSKSQLSAILQALGRIRDDPVVLSTATTLIAIAFQMPLTMQMLIFEKQILEYVAGVLKTVSTAALPDILALRHKDDFDTDIQHGCAVRICRLAHGHNLLDSGKVPLSTYNLALGALYGFSCSADVASVAMAPLLRSEMHVSGCLGLIAERLLTSSIPAFVDSQRKCQSKKPALAAGGSFTKRLGLYSQPLQSTDNSKNNINDNGYDDAWMGFDLPEETKGRGPPPFTATKSKSQPAGKRSEATGTKSARIGNRGANLFDRTLDNESSAMVPSLATIGMELEILRFCVAASTDNQDELLSMESCVPALLNLLTACQQSWVGVVDMSLDQVLETLALGLQLLVNLSYGSTMFCSGFFAYQGLETVAKSIALMSSEPNSVSGKHSQSVRHLGSFAPGSKTPHSKDTISSLKYDVLLISCALLINVMESDPSSTAYFASVSSKPT
ncbi:hypothetical protein EV177_006710, partial [Coemansia sp. RSA 1804]